MIGCRRSAPCTAVASTLLFLALALLIAPSALLAQTRDVIRGRIVAADSSPIPNATIITTDTAAKVAKPMRTDATGAFTVAFDDGHGAYQLVVTALGYAPQRRFVVRRSDGTMPTADFKMVPVAAQLGATKTVGERPKAVRSDLNGDASIGGTVTYQNLSNGLSGDVTGDISSMLATLPGISVTPSANGGTPVISAFGVGSDQNGLVLNGMNFGAQVPRDGFRLAVVSSTYDPSKGGFAGVQVSLRMTPGGNVSSRSLHGTFDAPSLQWTSPVASQLGTRYGQAVLSGTTNGPIVVDRVFYSTSFQFSRRSSGLTSLTSADPSSLEALHVNPDSVARLLNDLAPIGIPLRTSSVPGSRENLEGRAAVRLDWEPNLPRSQPGVFFLNNATVDDYYLEAGGTVRNNDGAMIGALSVPSYGGQQTHRDGWAQFTAAKYLPKSILNEATLSVSGADDATNPYLDLPAARILLASGLGDGTTGFSTLQVGGNSAPHSDSRNWSAELRNQTSWNTWDRRHSFSVTLDGTEDGYSIQQDAGFGTFAFNSLADFASGTPASYFKTLTGRSTSGTGFAGALGLGGTYNPNPPGSTPPGKPVPARPTVQYGVRFEGNHYGFAPDYNPSLDSVFHLRTDHVPSEVRIMPMFGFNWPIFPEYHFMGLTLGRRGSISGGVREYRGTLSTRALDSYTRQTGLPDAIQQLNCIGIAAPTPDWRAYEQSTESIPTDCAAGTTATVLTQTAPAVALFSPDYTFYDSWRPALTFNYLLNGMFRLSLNSTYAMNRNTPESYDLNFDGAPRFALASEGGRPVYVAPSSIVPTTGTSSWVDSRQSPLFAHVSEARSDLRGVTRTIGGTLTFSPFLITPTSSVTAITLGYNYTDAREQFRGFGGTTAGDPSVVDWSRGSVARHTITATVTRNTPNVGTLLLQMRAQSGMAFTPLVSGDVNGDGYANDRAFVFNPAAASDPTVGTSMAQLIRSSSPNVKRCLERQEGAVAGRNSCTGPWSMPLMNLSISPDPYRFGFRNRGSVQLLVTNILSGLDQALHGSNKLHGWGQPAFSDPTLLTVRGFDPNTNSFKYAVNPLFGSTSQFRNTYRSPFMLTVDVKLEVGRDRETQYLTSLLQLRPTDGDSLSLQQIKFRIARSFNPLDQIVAVKDSLSLTAAQVDSIKAIGQRFSVIRDSIVTDLARYLATRHGNYDGEQVRERWHAAGIASYTAYLKEVRLALALFTPAQRERAATVAQAAGFLRVEAISDADVRTMYRGAMASLP
ncbi:MAG TPA: carboxypeptidase-like regulatory domain-containing protein [Gemmatimonadaceae bacterium]|jgi:hypothetical protein